ncbi:MAG TPA: TIGR01212 family radical SAM protein, partial [Synergistales bacterium]|nr:TIGR01212 family radical SAM protein [Synergistales bacterium]
MTISGDRYSNWSSWLRERWGTRVYKIPLDTGAGCPNRDGIERGGCIFCDSLGGGGGAFLRGESLEEQILRGFRRLEKKPGDPMAIIYLQSYSSTNVSADRFAALIEKTLKISHSLGKVAGLAVGARPDQVPDEILDILEEAGIRNSIDVWLELGIQTVDPS